MNNILLPLIIQLNDRNKIWCNKFWKKNDRKITEIHPSMIKQKFWHEFTIDLYEKLYLGLVCVGSTTVVQKLESLSQVQIPS